MGGVSGYSNMKMEFMLILMFAFYVSYMPILNTQMKHMDTLHFYLKV